MQFNEFVRQYAKGAALLLASAAVSYFLTFHSTLTPPLKPRQAIYGMSVLVEAYGVLLGISSYKNQKAPLNWMILLIFIYVISLFSLTFLIPTSDTYFREAIGITCNPKFVEIYQSGCHSLDPILLEKASFEAERIWTSWSVNLIRIYLTAIWLLLVWSIVTSIAITIGKNRAQNRRRAR
jgi:hypothetical protein